MDFDSPLSAMFGAIGVAATYTPPAGAAQAITVVPRRPDVISEVGEARIKSTIAVFDVRKAELANPVKGGAITFAGNTYVIQSAPECRDTHRLIWTLNTRPA